MGAAGWPAVKIKRVECLVSGLRRPSWKVSALAKCLVGFTIAAAFDWPLSLEALSQEEKDLRFQSKAPGARYSPRVEGALSIRSLPEGIPFELGELSLYADFERAGPEGVPLYLINATDERVELSAQDGDPYVKLEVLDGDGRWVRAQNHLYSWCGNSYFIGVGLEPGMFRRLTGYMPAEGKTATVRYCRWEAPFLVSNAGEGLFLVEDLEAAKVDQMARGDLPRPLVRVFDEALSEDEAEVPESELVAFAFGLASRYAENGYYRRWGERYLARREGNPAARKEIRSALKRVWPLERDPEGLARVCLDRLDSLEANAGKRVLLWKVLAAALDGQNSELRASQRMELAEAAFARMEAVLSEGRDSVAEAASKLLELDALANYFVANESLYEWLQAENERVARRSMRLLSRREQFEGLAEAGFGLVPERQVMALEALARAGGGATEVRRSPWGSAEARFWVHCATEHPVETVAALDLSLWSFHRNFFDRRLRRPLVEFLEREAALLGSDPELVNNEEHGYPVARVVRFVGLWQREEDVPLLKRFLEHPGHQKSTGGKGSSEQEYAFYRYRVCQEAKAVLTLMGAPVPEGLVLEAEEPLE